MGTRRVGVTWTSVPKMKQLEPEDPPLEPPEEPPLDPPEEPPDDPPLEDAAEEPPEVPPLVPLDEPPVNGSLPDEPLPELPPLDPPELPPLGGLDELHEVESSDSVQLGSELLESPLGWLLLGVLVGVSVESSDSVQLGSELGLDDGLDSLSELCEPDPLPGGWRVVAHTGI